MKVVIVLCDHPPNHMDKNINVLQSCVLSLAHLHWLVAVATQVTPYFSEEPVAAAIGGGYL